MQFEQSYFEDEVRDGFYVPSEMKHAWAAQLEVLSDVDRVCRENHIEYFLNWGSLLGAIRHGGFIPWDDDLDICMKRPHFDRFMMLAESVMPDNYIIHKGGVVDGGINLVCRINNTDRISNDEAFLKKYHEFPYVVGLDIFPLDYTAPDEERDAKQMELLDCLVSAMLIFDRIGTYKNDELEARLKKIERMTRKTLKRGARLGEQLSSLWSQTCGMYGEEDSKYLTSMDLWKEEHSFRIPKEYFSSVVRVPFENLTVPVPAGYDALLRFMYGDYMKCIHMWNCHNYPFYRIQQDMLRESDGIGRRRYAFSEKESRRQPVMSKGAKQIQEYKSILLEAHGQIAGAIERGDGELVFAILTNCQNLAVQLGTSLEQQYKEGDARVKCLEGYCESVFRFAQMLQGEGEEEIGLDDLDAQIKSLHAKKTIVFLPVHAKDWGYMEGVWRAAEEDGDTEAYVVPVPYFYRNIDGQFLEMQYEGDAFPPEIAVTHYNAFDIKDRCPDVIVTQNAYDEYNPAISVHPYFYSKELRKYCGKLVYLPPFVQDDFDERDERAWQHIDEYATVPGVVLADLVIAGSQQMREQYLAALMRFAGKKTEDIWKEKIVSVDRRQISIAEEKAVKKKQVVYFTSFSALYTGKMQAVKKLQKVFSLFERDRGRAVMLWKRDENIDRCRHLIGADVWETYDKLLKQAQDCDWITDAAEYDERELVGMGDAFYGDAGVLAHLFERADKPVILQDING